MIIWVLGTVWVAFCVALMRGMDFGFQWESAPATLIFGIVWGFPSYLLIFFITQGGFVKRIKSAGKLLALGFALGLAFVSVEDFVFCQSASSQGGERQVRMRWWPLDDYTLVYSEGERYAID